MKKSTFSERTPCREKTEWSRLGLATRTRHGPSCPACRLHVGHAWPASCGIRLASADSALIELIGLPTAPDSPQSPAVRRVSEKSARWASPICVRSE